MNVTIPNIPLELYKGYKITKQGSMRFTDKFEKFDNSRGSSFYWLTAKHEDSDRSNYINDRRHGHSQYNCRKQEDQYQPEANIG